MSMSKKILYVMTAVLFAVVLLMCIAALKDQQPDLMSFRIPSGDDIQTVSLWERKDGNFYVFLPSYAESEHVKIHLHTGNTVQINGITVTDGMDCSPFSLEIPYVISWVAWGKNYQREITFLQSANVPAIYIDTQSGNMDYIHQEKGNKETGRITVYREDGTQEYSGTMESIQGRGNYTWNYYDKKAYSLKLSGAVDLLGMGEAQKWILLANAGDPTNLRNKIVYDFAAAVGLSYSPDCAWADLYLNGEYAGLYLLSERNEVHEERVDISADGSILVSQEVASKLEEQNIPSVTTEALQTFRIHYPLESNTDEMDKIQTVLQSVENAILSEDGIDSVTGKHWTELIDMESWVKKYLIEELFANGDAGAISQFYYLDGGAEDGKLYAGPVWDYDRAMGNPVAWQLLSPQAFYANRTHANPGYPTPWLSALYQDSIFYQNIINFYQQEFRPCLEKLLQQEIYEYVDQIEQASKMNDARWFKRKADPYIAHNDIIEYMNARINVLDEIWIEERPYYVVSATHSTAANYANYIVFQGECLDSLPLYEDTEDLYFDGWRHADTGELFDPEKPITEDLELYIRWRNKPPGLLEKIENKIHLDIFTFCLGVIFLLCLGMVFLAEIRRKSR